MLRCSYLLKVWIVAIDFMEQALHFSQVRVIFTVNAGDKVNHFGGLGGVGHWGDPFPWFLDSFST